MSLGNTLKMEHNSEEEEEEEEVEVADDMSEGNEGNEGNGDCEYEDDSETDHKAISPLDKAFPDLLYSLNHQTDKGEGMLRIMLVYTAIKYDRRRKQTIVSLIGRSIYGQSVAIFAEGWNSRLLVRAPERWDFCKGSATAMMLIEMLESKVRTRLEGTDEGERMCVDKMKSLIHSITTVSGSSIMGYTSEGPVSFLSIRVQSPDLIRPLRDCFHGYDKTTGNKKTFEAGLQIFMQPNKKPCLKVGASKTWESNIDPMMQFMSESNACGGGWFQIQRARLCEPSSTDQKSSTCDIEGFANVKDIEWLDPDVHFDMAPLRVLSFDIEAAAEKGTFPQAGTKGKKEGDTPIYKGDPVIQIAINFSILGQDADKAPKPILLNLRSCDPIEGVTVVCYDDDQEGTMLCDFARIVQSFNTDVITGYNIGLFDFPYLNGRADMFGLQETFQKQMSKLLWNRMSITVSFYCSSQGKQQRNKIRIPGAISFDMLVWMRNMYTALDSYKLDNVAQKYLDGEGKEGVHFTEITGLFNGTSADRKRLGIYCVQDAKLPISLMYKVNAIQAAIELARVTGTAIDWVLSRGTMSRFNSQLLRYGGAQSFFIPFIQSSEPGTATRKKAAYKGATVLEMKKGLYQYVITLDFAGMYPAIIIAHNLCFTTYTTDGSIPGSFCIVKGHYFVPASVRKGVIPYILEKLAAKRKNIKAALAIEKDPVKASALKAKELSVKITMNAIYGALGCSFALLPLMAIAETVTAVGRRDIATVQQIAEDLFSTKNGYRSSDIEVVCGDTDSIFISLRNIISDEKLAFDLDAISESIRLAEILVGRVNAVMEPPKKIEFEKVWRWLLNMCKKHYAGLMYVSHDKPPTINMKGVECVRRSGCNLVRKLVREVLEAIVHAGAVSEAASIVRRTILSVIHDEVPIEDYAINHVLRKNKQDCSHALDKTVLKSIRVSLLTCEKLYACIGYI